ncbi:MAG: hypothetical protein M5U26_26915 [Planctomycetota bacterium]|nr:hypothetical protein [Planctomycetota bacterium]
MVALAGWMTGKVAPSAAAMYAILAFVLAGLGLAVDRERKINRKGEDCASRSDDPPSD